MFWYRRICEVTLITSLVTVGLWSVGLTTEAAKAGLDLLIPLNGAIVATITAIVSIAANESALKRLFGATVRRYRQRLGLSQEELAWRAEMHRTYLADVERGVRNLSLSSMARLVGAIGVPLSTFFATLETLEPPPSNGSRRSGRAAKSA